MAMTAETTAYSPRGAAFTLLHTHAPEVVISGPAGTGKSVACLWKMHLAAEHKTGFRGLILRKTRESLSESALASFERFVMPIDHPARRGPSRQMRQVYRYPNTRAEIIVGGLDKPGKVMSTEFDLVYVQEAIDLDEHGWESVTTRLRNGVLPYQQLLADTNPDTPSHWLKRRCDAGRATMLESRHEDNPLLWDANAKDWTQFGRVYINRLDALTGPRKQRLRYGRWVQAEGVVYDGWDRAVHVIDRFPIPREWPRYWVIDFGYTNPFVWQAWAQDPDGRLYRYREIYRTQTLVEDHAKAIREATKEEPAPSMVICDHDAEDRATLSRHLGIGTVAAVKEVSPGIQSVAARLRPVGDGRPRLFLLRDSLTERDAALEERKLPCCTEEEFDGYVWNTAANRKQGEEPLKHNDHGMDALRYIIHYLDSGSGPWTATDDERNRSVFAEAPEGVFLP